MADDSITPELDRETIAFWVEVADLIGVSRSVAEAYAVIFLAAQPLNADDIVAKLGVGQGKRSSNWPKWARFGRPPGYKAAKTTMSCRRISGY